jgi:transposase InsO family protein
MSRKGNCWDNAVAESFFHSMKTELIYTERYATRESAKQSVFQYIEVYYNRIRLLVLSLQQRLKINVRLSHDSVYKFGARSHIIAIRIKKFFKN